MVRQHGYNIRKLKAIADRNNTQHDISLIVTCLSWQILLNIRG